jgi:uncharacterized YccA/Bax inhibitor family protein
MKTAIRAIITLLTVLTIYFFCYWYVLSFIHLPQNVLFIKNLIALLIAIVVGYFVWKRTGNVHNSLAKYILLGGIIVGSVSFVLGFFGPLIFTPENNLGPLLGIFITGPVGFVVGLIGGGLYWKIKNNKQLKNTIE